MNHKERGIVLLSTMLLLSLLVSILNATTNIMALYSRMIFSVEQSHQVSEHINEAAMWLAKQDKELNACISRDREENQLIEDVLYDKGCQCLFNSRHYNYIWFDLGLFPCVKVKKGEIFWGTHHWVLTVVDRADKRTVIQMHVVEPIAVPPCTDDVPGEITPGIVSWRQLKPVEAVSNIDTYKK